MSQSDTNAAEWLSLERFCEELDVSLDGVQVSSAGARSGRFPRYTKLPNGRIRIRRDWLDAWLEDREVAG